MATPTAADRIVENGSSSAFDWPSALPSPAVLANAECSGASPCDPANFVGGTLTGDRRRARVEMRLPNPVPAGGRVESVRLVIDHREDNPRDSLRDLTVELVEGDAVFECNGDLTGDLDIASTWHRTSFDCPGTLDHPLPQDLSELHVVFRIELNREQSDEPTPSFRFEVDRVAVEAQVTEPVLRRQSGCVVTTDCRFLYLDNENSGSDGRLAVRGTVYSPLARVRLRLGGVASGWLTRGVVTANLQIDNPPGGTGYFPVSLPGGGSYADRLVTFAAYLGTDTDPILTARVRFCDFQPEGGPCGGAGVQRRSRPGPEGQGLGADALARSGLLADVLGRQHEVPSVEAVLAAVGRDVARLVGRLRVRPHARGGPARRSRRRR